MSEKTSIYQLAISLYFHFITLFHFITGCLDVGGSKDFWRSFLLFLCNWHNYNNIILKIKI